MLKRLTLFAMMFIMLCGVCACSSTPTETLQPSPSEPSQPTQTPQATPKSDLTLADFTIIYPSDEITGIASKNAALNLRMEISSKLSVKNGMYGDQLSLDGENNYEILIGATNRAESTDALDGKVLRYYDYVIKYMGTKLVVNGGSDFAVTEAVNYIINNLLDENLTTVDGFKNLTQIDYVYTYSSNIGKFTINGNSLSDFKIISKLDATSVNEIIDDILVATGEKLSTSLELVETEYEILIGECNREEYKQVEATLNEYDYAIKVVNNKLVIAAKNEAGLEQAVNKFKRSYLNMNCDEFDLNKDNDFIYIDKYEDQIITVDGINLRDPCVLLHDGIYYMYGTWWQCYKNTTGNLQSGWEKVQGDVVVFPEDAYTDYWAPEVHEYNGKFYMFTTYRSSKNEKRGCAVFRADSPEGPFELISDGHVTPSDRNCIDGTLYVDEDGQPWMVFVLEWVDTDMGGMACAKLSEDLTHFISEPVELFDADAPKWATSNVTDGPWLYRCESGELIMIWSNFSSDGYAVGIAHSTTGLVTGPWIQDDETFFPIYNHKKYDGGHGMLFTDIKGNMWMSVHSPNTAQTDRPETPVFIPVKEENGTLIFDDSER